MRLAARWGSAGLAAIAAVLAPVSDSSAAPNGRPCHHCRGRLIFPGPFDDQFYGPPFLEEPPPSGYPPLLNDPREDAPFVVEPTPRPESIPAPYPQGFALDVVTPTSDEDAQRQQPTGPLNRYREVADRLAACWQPPSTFDGAR